MTDETAFEQFMRQFQDMVYTTALRLLADPAEAEDITQQVFLKAYEHFDQFRENAKAVGWLKTVTVNASLNHLTRYRRRWRLFSEMSSCQHQDPFDHDTIPAQLQRPAPEPDYDRRELVEHLLRKLPISQRVPLVLFHLEGMSYQEIADKLGISLAKVNTDIFRARQTLRQWLQEQREELRSIQ